MENSLDNCPYILVDTTEGYVCCTASSFGKGLDGKEKFCPLTRDVIVNCNSAEHKGCPTFKRKRRIDELNMFLGKKPGQVIEE